MFKPTLIPDVKPQDRPYPFPDNPDPYKPTFTLQENLIETTRRVNETLDRVLRMEENIRKTMESYTSTITADNVAFKNLMTTTHNQFAGEVTNEINSFEADLTNSYSTLSTDTQNRIDDFYNSYVEKLNEYKEELNNTYNDFREAIESRIDQHNESNVETFNGYVTELNTRLTTMETTFNKDYSTFTKNVNDSINNFKIKWVAEIEARLAGQDIEISEAVNYLKTNLSPTITNEVRALHDSGKLAEIINAEILANKVESSVFTSKVNTLATKEELDVERKRINSLAYLPSGSTQGDAELADIRIGADNVTYLTAGAAVRTQFTNINNVLKGNKFLHGIGTATTTQGTFEYNDLDSLPVNSIMTIAGTCEWLAHQPIEGFVGTVVTLSQSPSAVFGGGTFQIAFDPMGKYMYTRIAWGSPVSWKEWKRTSLGEFDKTTMLSSGYKHIKEGNTLNYTSFDDLPLNEVVIVDNVKLTNSPNEIPCGTCITFKGLIDGSGSIQIFMQNTGKAYLRVTWSGNWQPWQDLTNNAEIVALTNDVEVLKTSSNTMNEDLNQIKADMLELENVSTPMGGLISSFLKIGCIGDSLSSGESEYLNEDGSKGLIDLYDHSWGQFMAREYGVDVLNFSCGGLTTRTWLTISHGLEKATTEGNECNAYIIGLGQNDRSKLGADYLGTINDIDVDNCENNADTYYGNYAKIIQKMKEVQPKAKFFLLPDPIETSGTFNHAVEDIASLFDNCYFIDLMKYADMYKTGGFFFKNKRGGHYNSLGYNLMGKLIGKEISLYMYENLEEFAQLEFIGTDYEY